MKTISSSKSAPDNNSDAIKFLFPAYERDKQKQNANNLLSTSDRCSWKKVFASVTLSVSLIDRFIRTQRRLVCEKREENQ